jgi:hypothetical protein
LGDAQIHPGKVFHDLARVFQIVHVADEGSCMRVLKDVLELPHPVKEVHREDHSPDFRQGIVSGRPVYRVWHHQYADIPRVKPFTNESMGQAIHVLVQLFIGNGLS